MKVGLNYTLNSQHHTLYDVVACSAVLCCVVWSFMSSHQSFPFESCYWWALWCVQLAYGKMEKLNRTGCDVRLCKYCVLKHPISNFWCCYWTHQVLVRPHFIWMFQWRLLFECSLVKVQATLGWKDIFAWSSLIARFKLSSIEFFLGKSILKEIDVLPHLRDEILSVQSHLHHDFPFPHFPRKSCPDTPENDASQQKLFG